MRSFGVLLLTALMYLTSNCNGERKSWTVPIQSKEFLVPGTLYFHDHSSYTFGRCEAKDEDSERGCNVTLITRPSGKEQHCPNVRVFASEGRQLFLNGYFQLWPYSRSRVLIGWWEQTRENDNVKRKSILNVGLLNMEDCETAYQNFPIDKVDWGFFPSFLLYPNQLNVILNSKETCKNSDNCIVTYDLVGKQVGEVEPYQPNLSGYASPVSITDPQKGFYMAVQKQNDLTVLLIDSNGNEKELMTDEFEDGVTEQRAAFSNAHEYYAICRLPVVPTKKPTKIHCTQFNWKGTRILKNEVTVPQAVGWMALRNLPEGGFILATSACDVPRSSDAKNCRAFNVYKVDTAGRQSVKPKTINDFDLECYEGPESPPDHSELGARIYENSENELCFDFSCLRSNTLNYTHKCVSRETIEDIKV